MPDIFDQVAAQQGASSGDIFDRVAQGLATPTPSPSPEGGFQFLPRSGAQMDVSEGRQAIQQLPDLPFAQGLGEAGLEVLPQTLGQAGRMVGEAVGGPAATTIEQLVEQVPQAAQVIQGLQEGKPLSQAVEEVLGKQKTYPEFSAEDWGKLTGRVGISALQALPFVAEGLNLRAPESPIVGPRTPPDLPPSPSMGPGTTARDVSNALLWTPQSPPITPLESAIAKVQPPGPYVSPETGFTHYPGLEGHAPVPSDWAYPPPPIGTPLKPVPLVVNGEPVAANVAAAQAQPPPVAPAPEPYTPEAAAARSQQTSRAQPNEAVGGNVAGFEQVYGPGEIPAGPTLTPEDAWDAAHLRAQLGQSNPYGFVARAKTGAITPAEMGDLIYEHHRLVERAAGMEGTPDYEGAYQAAKDFANNVLKPAETAWHQKGMTMQIKQPVDFSTETGMRNAMDRMNVELKANQVSEANRIVRENANAAKGVQASEGKLMQAMEREYSRGAKRSPKTAEQLRAQLAETEPCAL